MLNFFEIYVGVCVCVCISVCVCVYLCVCVYGVTVPQPTAERASQSTVTWPNIRLLDSGINLTINQDH